MILNLHHPPHDIGARRIGCNDGNGKWNAEQPYVLVREVTQADWIQFCREMIGPHYPTPEHIEHTKRDRFFEVATD